MPDAHKNFAYSTVATAPSPATSGTSLVVHAGDGTLFPAVPFNVTIWPAGVKPTAANAEVGRVTARSTDTLTLVRAQEGSTARSVVVGDQIAATVTVKALTDLELMTRGTDFEPHDLPCETTPATISNSKYNAFGMHAIFPSGKQIICYREATAHLTAGVYGTEMMRTSLDQGKTWTAAATIDSEASVDLRDIYGGITRTGRIVVFYTRCNPAIPGGAGFVLGFRYQYSDDEGVTWSGRQTFTPTGDTTYTGGFHGQLIELASGTLMITYFAWSSLVGGTKQLRAQFSTDNGATWGNDTLIVSDATIQWSEATFAYVGGNTIIGISRTDNGTVYKQLVSTDNGATWSNLGDWSVDSWSTPGPPTLVTYQVNGKRMLVCYWVNRTDGNLYYTTASAASLIANGVSAWASKTSLASGLNEPDSGYVAAIHPFGSPAGIGWFYNGQSSSVADIKFFISNLGPPAGGGGGSATLDLVQRITDLAVTATTHGTAQTWIDGSEVTYDGTTRVKISCFCPCGQVTSGGLIIEIYDGSTFIGRIAEIVSDTAPMPGLYIVTPTAGTHTYHFKVWSDGSSPNLYSAAPNFVPSYLLIETI